jgi:hypothetical protein
LLGFAYAPTETEVVLMGLNHATKMQRLTVGMSILCLAGVCAPPPAELWIDSGSSKGVPTFRISETRDTDRPIASLVGLVISRYPCESGAGGVRTNLWTLTATDGIGPKPPPTRITYGIAPSGYTEVGGAPALREGCHEALVVGARLHSYAHFRVSPDGAIANEVLK